MVRSIEIITVVPQFWESFCKRGAGLVGRAIEDGRVEFKVTDLREFGLGPQRQIDDSPFGGGAGMVLRPEPAVAALHAAQKRAQGLSILLSPAGKRFEQADAQALSQQERLIVFCPRYEGLDARVEPCFDLEISMGDFVCSGGDPAATTMLDAVLRLVPEVLGNADSLSEESFSGQGLEYPQYTRPQVFEGHAVPEILLSGDHGKIAAWRQQAGLQRTAARRPDLLDTDPEPLEQ